MNSITPIKLIELMQQHPHAIPLRLAWEECARVDDAPLTNAVGEGRGDGGSEQGF